MARHRHRESRDRREGVEKAVAFALESFGKAPDILINNLGVGDSTPFEEITDDRWARSIDVNLMGTVRTCRALVPKMAAQGGGAVVNTGSDLAKQPEPAFIDYGASKAALLYLTKALAKQVRTSVRVNSVLPGPIWSRMWTRPGGIVDQLIAHYGVDRDAAVKRFLEDRQMPMGIGNPADRRARRRVPRLAAGEIHHGRGPGYRWNYTRTYLDVISFHLQLQPQGARSRSMGRNSAARCPRRVTPGCVERLSCSLATLVGSVAGDELYESRRRRANARGGGEVGSWKLTNMEGVCATRLFVFWPEGQDRHRDRRLAGGSAAPSRWASRMRAHLALAKHPEGRHDEIKQVVAEIEALGRRAIVIPTDVEWPTSGRWWPGPRRRSAGSTSW